MPYLITATTPNHTCGQDVPRFCWCPETVTRRAVGTLDEAQLTAHTLVEEHRSEEYQHRAKMSRAVNAALKLPAAGGTVGPLPDGTVITVERVSWKAIGMTYGPGLQQHALDAYNAAQVIA